MSQREDTSRRASPSRLVGELPPGSRPGPPRIPGSTDYSALTESYTFHSPLPSASGRYLLGVDEAGRGPVLGPLVYGIAYCPIEYKTQLEEMGFADSKTLGSATRDALLTTLSSDPMNLGWSVRVLRSVGNMLAEWARIGGLTHLSPQAISSGMLRHPPTNLNVQSENATILLIREVLAAGLDIAEVYVDALGPSVPYQAYLSGLFPTMSITVKPKADSIYPIVSAASIAAKVTRDAWLEGWIYEETLNASKGKDSTAPMNWLTEERGSGYPSDPKTQAWLKKTMEPTFGFPNIARFSWATVKIILQKDAHAVEWMDEGQSALIKSFESANARDKGRCIIAKETGLRSVGDL